MGTFRVKNSSDLRHIVAKKALTACQAGGPLMYRSHCQAFLFFAHLRPREQVGENIAFSVLKNSGPAAAAPPCVGCKRGRGARCGAQGMTNQRVSPVEVPTPLVA